MVLQVMSMRWRKKAKLWLWLDQTRPKNMCHFASIDGRRSSHHQWMQKKTSPHFSLKEIGKQSFDMEDKLKKVRLELDQIKSRLVRELGEKSQVLCSLNILFDTLSSCP